MTRAAVYVRISRDAEGMSHGVGRQEEDARALAAARGWDVVEPIYSDNDITASGKKTRPGWESMLADIEAGKVDAVVAYSSSRMYRRPADLARLIELAKARRLDIATVASGNIDLDTADGRMIAGLLATIDQGELERIQERVKRSRAQMAEQGRWGGGRRPFGMQVVGKPGAYRLEPDPVEMGHLRDAVSMLLNGASLYTVAHELNDRGATTSGGNSWTPSALLMLFKSGHVAQLVSRRDLDAIRARFPGTGVKSVSALLTGLLRCGVCGAPLVSNGPRYVCPEVVRRGGQPGHVSVPKAALEDYVGDQAHQAELPEVQAAADVTDELIARRDTVEAELSALRALLKAGSSLPGVAEREQELAQDLAGIERTIEQAPPSALTWAEYLEAFPYRARIESVVDHVVVKPGVRGRPFSPDRVAITWRAGVRAAS